MKNLSAVLLVTIFSLALVGCKKKSEPVIKNSEKTQQSIRVSGPFAEQVKTIAWDEEDRK